MFLSLIQIVLPFYATINLYTTFNAILLLLTVFGEASDVYTMKKDNYLNFTHAFKEIG